MICEHDLRAKRITRRSEQCYRFERTCLRLSDKNLFAWRGHQHMHLHGEALERFISLAYRLQALRHAVALSVIPSGVRSLHCPDSLQSDVVVQTLNNQNEHLAFYCNPL